MKTLHWRIEMTFSCQRFIFGKLYLVGLLCFVAHFIALKDISTLFKFLWFKLWVSQSACFVGIHNTSACVTPGEIT